MDAHEQLAWDSEAGVSVAVLGKGEDFVLISLDGQIDEAATATALAKGFSYCGVLGIKNGQAAVKCEPDSNAVYTMMHAALAFAAQVAERLREKPKGDAVEWLESLYRLPDTREN
jgi:hypothetical protein